MNTPATISMLAPAKINLGLEILGKRHDGYHEIRTVMVMVDLADEVRVGRPGAFTPSIVAGVGHDANLVTRALNAYREHAPNAPPLAWSIDKRIPVAAGLGGASSNAAAALMAANSLNPDPLSRHQLHAIAGGLGSDVPFFLDGPTAIATGRGTELSKVHAPRIDLLIVVPGVDIPGKTGALYGLIEPRDFSDGTRAESVVHVLETGDRLTTPSLANAFTRPLRGLIPQIGELQEFLEVDLQLQWGLSGAGPAHYVLTDPETHAEIRRRLDSAFPEWLRMFSTHSLTAGPASASGESPG